MKKTYGFDVDVSRDEHFADRYAITERQGAENRLLCTGMSEDDAREVSSLLNAAHVYKEANAVVGLVCNDDVLYSAYEYASLELLMMANQLKD